MTTTPHAPGPTSGDTVRRAVLAAVPVLGLVAVVAASAVLADRLPAELASHWSGGAADGWTSLPVLTSLNGVLVVALGGGLVWSAVRLPVGPMGRPLAGVATGLVAFLAGLHVVTVQASVDAASRAAVPFPAGGLLGSLAAALLVGTLGWAVAPEGRRAEHVELDGEPLEVGPGEAVVWTGGAVAPLGLHLLLVLVAGVGAVLLVVSEPWVGVLLLVVALVGATMLRVRVTVGPAGLTARTGPFGVVTLRGATEDITAVHAERIEPMAYGGWGYRVVPGARGLVLRRGEGLRVERGEAQQLVVTVEGAAHAAAVLRAHVGARSD